jgi:hypothetical protein
MTHARIPHLRSLGTTDPFLYEETSVGRAIVPASKNLLATAGEAEIVPEAVVLSDAQIDTLVLRGIHLSFLPFPLLLFPLLSDDRRVFQPVGLPRRA